VAARDARARSALSDDYGPNGFSATYSASHWYVRKQVELGVPIERYIWHPEEEQPQPLNVSKPTTPANMPRPASRGALAVAYQPVTEQKLQEEQPDLNATPLIKATIARFGFHDALAPLQKKLKNRRSPRRKPTHQFTRDEYEKMKSQ
jgi:hypothetical protein